MTGAEPIGIIDHLQFGSPENPQIYWTFRKSVEAIIDFCNYMKVPVVGGEVRLFIMETMSSPIKPSPVIGTIGLIKDRSHITKCDFQLLAIHCLFWVKTHMRNWVELNILTQLDIQDTGTAKGRFRDR